MLAKSWRRIKNNILLYKSGTEGFANSGLEPYSEYYASQIAKTMDLHYVNYGLSKWKGKLCQHVYFSQMKMYLIFQLEEY
mgnify:CR=1 FL=1